MRRILPKSGLGYSKILPVTLLILFFSWFFVAKASQATAADFCNQWKGGFETLGVPQIHLGSPLTRYRGPTTVRERGFRRPIDGAIVDIVETDRKSSGLKLRLEVVLCDKEYIVVGIYYSGTGSIKSIPLVQWEDDQRRQLSAYNRYVEIKNEEKFVELSVEKARLRDPGLDPLNDVMKLYRRCYISMKNKSNCVVLGWSIYYARI